MSFLGKVAKNLRVQFAVAPFFAICTKSWPRVWNTSTRGTSNHDGTFWRCSHDLAPPDLATGSRQPSGDEPWRTGIDLHSDML